MKHQKELNIVNSYLNYPKVTLIPTSKNYFIHIAAEVDQNTIPFFITQSSKKKTLIKFCKQQTKKLEKIEGVVNCSVFKATVIPPGQGQYILENSSKTHLAKFDVAILIEVNSTTVLHQLQTNSTFTDLIIKIKETASFTHCITASNARRIGAVNHARQGVFLFNYFYGKSIEQNLSVWEYTAGWFEKETDLDNSTLLLPIHKEDSSYTIINHCRWNTLWDIIPDLLFKRTFKKYVLDNFYANQVGAQPILYKLA